MHYDSSPTSIGILSRDIYSDAFGRYCARETIVRGFEHGGLDVCILGNMHSVFCFSLWLAGLRPSSERAGCDRDSRHFVTPETRRLRHIYAPQKPSCARCGERPKTASVSSIANLWPVTCSLCRSVELVSSQSRSPTLSSSTLFSGFNDAMTSRQGSIWSG